MPRRRGRRILPRTLPSRSRLNEQGTRPVPRLGALGHRSSVPGLLGMNYDEDEGGRHVNIGKGGIVDHGKTQEIIETARRSQQAVQAHQSSARVSQEFDPARLRGASDPSEPEHAHLLHRAHGRHHARQVAGDPVAAGGRAHHAVVRQSDRRQVGGDGVHGRWPHRTNAACRTRPSPRSARTRPNGRSLQHRHPRRLHRRQERQHPGAEQKSKDNFALLQPLVARGGVLVVVGTTWADDDLYADLEANPLFAPPQGGQVICGAGVRVITNIDGRMDLEVLETGLTFPHLTKEY